MSTLNKILEHNKEFVKRNDRLQLLFKQTEVSKIPSNQLAILTCMDTRLVEFLEQATGIRRGGAKIIKNAGNIVAGSFGETIRSLIISIFELNVKEVIVIGHHDCGMAAATSGNLKTKMIERGISEEAIKVVDKEFEEWVDAYHDPIKNTLNVVQTIKKNPFIPNDILVHGLVFCPDRGELEVLHWDGRESVSHL